MGLSGVNCRVPQDARKGGEFLDKTNDGELNPYESICAMKLVPQISCREYLHL
jgi:hypothetical protein